MKKLSKRSNRLIIEDDKDEPLEQEESKDSAISAVPNPFRKSLDY